MGESAPEPPNGPKHPEFAATFDASVRRGGDRSPFAGRVLTAGLVILVAGAAALCVGAVSSHSWGHTKTMNAAARRSAGTAPSSAVTPTPRPSATPKRTKLTLRPRVAQAQPPKPRTHHRPSKPAVHNVVLPNDSSLVGVASRRCLDVSGGQAKDGTPLEIWDCNNLSPQKWTPGPNGSLRAMGLCMDAAYGSAANGTVVQLVNCDGLPAQRFGLNSVHELKNLGSGMCVAVKGGQTSAGARLQLWDCTGKSDEKWTIR